MRIRAECPGCGRVYSVGPERAGSRLRCKECREIFDVPTGPRRSEVHSPDRGPVRAVPRRAGPTSAVRRAAVPAGRIGADRRNQRTLLIAGGAGAVLFATLVAVAVFLFSRDRDAASRENGLSASNSGAASPFSGRRTLPPWKPFEGWDLEPVLFTAFSPAQSLPGLPYLAIRIPSGFDMRRHQQHGENAWTFIWAGPSRTDHTVAGLVLKVVRLPADVDVASPVLQKLLDETISQTRRTFPGNWRQEAPETGNVAGHPFSRFVFRGTAPAASGVGRMYSGLFRGEAFSLAIVAAFFDAEEYAGGMLSGFETAVLSMRPVGLDPLTNPPDPAADLAAARHEFHTKLLMPGKSPQQYQDDPVPSGVDVVHYPSGPLQLKAWLSADPGDGQKRPAVVYLHNGWAFGASDWTDAAPFLEAGYVVMVPTLRAENGNPGHFELLYGEVDDAVAAGQYVAALDYVDPENVYVVGDGAGAMLACLVALMPSPYRAAAALNATVDHRSFVASDWHQIVPYDSEDPEEVRLRNPLAFVASLKCPLFVFVEERHPDLANNRAFVAAARSLGKTCELFELPPNQMIVVAPFVQKTIALFAALRAGD